MITHIKVSGGEEARRECPECHSRRNWKDGIRETNYGSVQRFLCRDCGFRFSQKSNIELHVNTGRQLGAIFKEAKKLDSATETKTVAGESQKATQDSKGKILEFAWHLKKQNSSDSTIKTFTCLLKKLVNNGANLDDTESVKEVLAKLNVSPNSKTLIVATYSSYLKFHKRSWIPPKYKRQDKIPFIPQEAEVDALISGCSRRISALLLLLKETGMRIGEACRLKWTDMNAENNTVAVNEPEKGSNARIIRVSQQLIRVIEALPKKCERVFGKSNKTDKSHSYQRQRIWLSKKLSNPRLQKITFHTFRHWKATMEYHKTKDIGHVQRLLGHRNIQNTLRYINLEQAIFEDSIDQFHVKVADSLDEACKLLEVGFDYVTDMDGKKLFRKRK